MVNRIIKGMVMPILLSALLLLWEELTTRDFRYFWGIFLFFILGFILNILLIKKIGYSFHLFFYFYFFIAMGICLLITPSPHKGWQNFQSLFKKKQPIRVSDLSMSQANDLVFFKDARTLQEGMGIESYGAGKGGGENGGRGIIPVVDKNYQPGDSIYVYAAFTTYVADEGNDSWFILNKDEHDYAEDWKQPVVSGKIIRDTARIHLYSKLMKKANSQYKLVPADQVTFIQSNFPTDDFNYVAHKLTVVGIIMLVLAAAMNMYGAVKGYKKEGVRNEEDATK